MFIRMWEKMDSWVNSKLLEDIKLEDLCLQSVMAKKNDPNDFPGSCIRLKNHKGKCQKITNGMTEKEALAITIQDLE